ncbi:MAG TPA: T9SS type A sorting domain-containing protein, partial [Sunxiuqinia sp.]|nr:T9SS type A sorting domain-containing protein [Sunxiuqinia sp.]
VEVSRDYASDPPTVAGYFIVDLSAMDYVDGIQWTHSSCGGSKRGVLLEYSTDMGANWDTLRFQGSNGATGWTKDITSGMVTQNEFNCDPSAYGMTWEDGIYYSATEGHPLWLRFMVSDGQVPRIHDMKIYGTYVSTSSTDVKSDILKIYSFNKEIHISEQAKVAVYNVNGMLVKSAEKTNLILMSDMPNGVYLVKAQIGSKVKTSKVLIK